MFIATNLRQVIDGDGEVIN